MPAVIGRKRKSALKKDSKSDQLSESLVGGFFGDQMMLRKKSPGKKRSEVSGRQVD